MQGKQMSMYDFGVVDELQNEKMESKHIAVSVESPAGTVWTQDIEVKPGETNMQAMMRYKKSMLGKGYYVRFLYSID